MRFATLVFIATYLAVIEGGTASGQQPSSSKPVQGGAQPQTSRRPLEALVGEHILVLPAQYVTFADSLGWAGTIPSIRDYLGTLDDELTFALAERGLKGRWTFADGITRAVKRNPQITADPHAIDATEVRIGSHPDEWQLHDPFASQLRSLIALSEARYVLIPVELRLSSSHGLGHATLHVVLIDARRSHVQWMGDISGAPMAKFTPAIAADIASRLAEMVAPPTR
jgi:hypothetical protein